MQGARATGIVPRYAPYAPARLQRSCATPTAGAQAFSAVRPRNAPKPPSFNPRLQSFFYNNSLYYSPKFNIVDDNHFSYYIKNVNKKITIGVVVGSARKDSYSRKVAAFVASHMPANFETRTIAIGSLPMYNQDYDDEGKTPPEWTALREEVQSMDGFLFVTPEYNRSFSPLLKNALDIASRPYGKNVWNGKPGALIGVSPGKMGAFGAAQHLRQVLSFLNILLLQQPEAYLGDAAQFLDEREAVTNQSTAQFLESFANAFASWVEKIRG